MNQNNACRDKLLPRYVPSALVRIDQLRTLLRKECGGLMTDSNIRNEYLSSSRIHEVEQSG